MSAQRLLLRILLGCLAAAGILGAIVVLSAGNDIADKMIVTLVLTAACCGALIYTARWIANRATMTAGTLAILLIVAEFIIGTALIWDIPKQYGSDPD